MREVSLDDAYFLGAISLERNEAGVKPWRIPWRLADLFPPDVLVQKAEVPAGVRIGFESDTTSVVLRLAPSSGETAVDCVVDDDLHATGLLPAGETEIRFHGLAAGRKRVELFLSQKVPVQVRGLAVDDGAAVEPLQRIRPRWVTYGSSITQCAAAASPAQTWPAIVARRRGLDLTCLGYGGQCHLDPMIARMIRDLPADLLSFCLGINVMGAASLSIRTFRPAVIGLIQIVREKHPDTPIAVFSPIYSPPRETKENAVGLNLVRMREEIQEAVTALRNHGDTNLHYVDGLSIFGPADEAHLPDQLHPDAEGYRIMAERIDRILFDELGLLPVARRQAG